MLKTNRQFNIELHRVIFDVIGRWFLIFRDIQIVTYIVFEFILYRDESYIFVIYIEAKNIFFI